MARKEVLFHEDFYTREYYFETIEMLKLLAKDYSKYVSYNDNSGIRIVQFTKELSKEQVLNDYYNAHI